jgi:YYY domain-containing protein
MSLGAMPLINTWDVLIYAPITVIVLLLIVMRSWRTTERNQSLAGLFSIPVASILAYIPFYLQLKAHTGGISNVRAPSDPIEFLLVNGFFIAVIVAFLYRDIAKRPWLLAAAVPFALPGYMAAAIAAIPLVYLIHRLLFQDEKDAAELLAIFGLMILIACELIYMKDSMGETYFRMNTIFKCYLPAWILLSISISAMIGRALAGILPVIPPWSARALAAIGIAALFILPFMIPFNAGYGTGTLDGLEYISNTHPGDAGAVAYLRTLGGNEVIVEAEGGDYTYSSRVSSFTGIPAIIGMPFHEYMWRGDDTGWFAARPGEIKTIYEKPGQAAGLMRKYNATLLYVGDSERDRYKVSLPGEGFEKVYSAQGTEIYWLGA